VITEQERMLEERRVGLISQEEVIKKLRLDKERSFKSIAQLRAERDEAVTNSSRTAAQIVALEDENRRMGRLLVETQTDSSRGGGGNVDHMMRLTGELKEARVDFKKVEADRERVAEQYESADRDRQKLEGRLAQLEVELQKAQHGKFAAESARNVAQDALAKAEVAQHPLGHQDGRGDRAGSAVDRQTQKKLLKQPQSAGASGDPGAYPADIVVNDGFHQRLLRERSQDHGEARPRRQRHGHARQDELQVQVHS
jgi:chromosome segregation ATPase